MWAAYPDLAERQTVARGAASGRSALSQCRDERQHAAVAAAPREHWILPVASPPPPSLLGHVPPCGGRPVHPAQASTTHYPFSRVHVPLPGGLQPGNRKSNYVFFVGRSQIDFGTVIAYIVSHVVITYI